MRRTLAAVAAAVAVSTVAAVLPVVGPLAGPSGSVAAAGPARTAAPAAAAAAALPAPGAAWEDGPRVALDRAARALRAPARTTAERRSATGRPDATLALTDLFAARSRLRGGDRALADSLLARPTQGARDPFGDGYRVRSTRACSSVVCVHWVRRTADAPPSDAWARRTLAAVTRVWRFQVGTMGYRPPVQDRGQGGDRRFDVYLKDVGSRGVYGYCAPEYRKPGTKFVASGFCVLDDDFARAQFRAAPRTSLAVTAAHEFFHAVQFAYDYHEDKWLLESTATWMEERFADGADDNRQYLASGQVRNPGLPLDVFDPDGFAHYGNWAFWEHLSRRYGAGVVRAVWTQAGAFQGAGNLYSTRALAAVLRKRGGFTSVFTRYAALNAVASRSYPEGATWPSARVRRTIVLGARARRATTSARIDHMAAQHVALRPGSSLKGKRWRLRVTVDAPPRRAGSAAYLIVKKRQGAWTVRPVPLTRRGIGSQTFSFGRNQVRSAVVTLVNADTSFRCYKRQPFFSCQGVPTGDNRKFVLKARLLRR